MHGPFSSMLYYLLLVADSQSISLHIDDDLLSSNLLTSPQNISISSDEMNAKMRSIPLELKEAIIQYVHIDDIHSLLQTCRSYSILCKRHIRGLLSRKFRYLLKDNNAINIDHLMQLPMVYSTSAYASKMHIFFNKDRRNKKSIYIGIDSISGNAFISFWIQSVQIHNQECKIITIVFNETNIHRIYVSETMSPLSFLYPTRFSSLYYKQSYSNNIEAMNTLILTGKISSILGETACFCLKDKWDSCAFWLKIREQVWKSCNTTGSLVWAIIAFICLLILFANIGQLADHYVQNMTRNTS